MSDNYHQGTGVLVLGKATPIIQALFGDHSLDENYPGGGEIYVATSEVGDWDEVYNRLIEVAEELGIEIEDGHEDLDDAVEDLVEKLATHFGTADSEELGNLLDQIDPDNTPGLQELFVIAQHLNDGHDLKAIKFEVAWTCSKPRLFEFGGAGEYIGKHFTKVAASYTAVSFGEEVDQALAAGRIDDAAEAFASRLLNDLAGVNDIAHHDALLLAIAKKLRSKTNELPTAVLDIEGGAIHGVSSNEPMRIIILDADVEGSDGEKVHMIDGDKRYVHDFNMGGPLNGDDVSYVDATIERVDDLQYVIYSASEAERHGGDAGYWNNESGWVTRENATHFKHAELPELTFCTTAGDDATWVSAEDL